MQAVTNAHLKTPLVRDLITATLVTNEAERQQRISAIEGVHGGALERSVYGVMRKLSDAYDAGHWFSYALSNGGFYMTPNPHKNILVPMSIGGMDDVQVSADTAGIIVSALVFSHFTLTKNSVSFQTAYALLSHFIFQHRDAGIIRAALD